MASSVNSTNKPSENSSLDHVSLSIVGPDEDACPPAGTGWFPFGIVMEQAASLAPESIEAGLGNRICATDQKVNFRFSDWHDRPILGIITVRPVDYFSENGDKTLSTRAARANHHVEMRLVDKVGFVYEIPPRRVCGLSRRRPALLTSELLTRPVFAHRLVLPDHSPPQTSYIYTNWEWMG